MLGVSLSFSVTAQVQHVADTNQLQTSIETRSLVMLYTNALSKNKLEEDAGATFVDKISIAKAVFDYNDMAKIEFGSYVNPYNNQLMIVPTDDIKYTKIQIIKKGTGISVIKKKIDKGNNMIDMSNIESGKYILIMTNDERNLYSEEITIL